MRRCEDCGESGDAVGVTLIDRRTMRVRQWRGCACLKIDGQMATWRDELVPAEARTPASR